MPADDSGLEFEDDLEQAPSARPAAAGPRAAKSGRKAPAAARNKRTRKPLGLGGKKRPPRREKPKVSVQIVGLDRSFEAEVGRDLRGACRDNHVNVFWGPWAQAFNCRGVATCGLCKVEVVEGLENLAPRTKKEEKRLRGKPDNWRLACHATLTGNVRIDPLPRISVDQQVGEEAIGRALLSEDEREELRENARAARQAEREQAKGTEATPKPKNGLLARFQKKDGDGSSKQEGEGKKGPLGGLRRKKAPKDAKKPAKKETKGAKKQSGKEAQDAKQAAAAPDDAATETPEANAKGDDKSAKKKGFGLKGRRS